MPDRRSWPATSCSSPIRSTAAPPLIGTTCIPPAGNLTAPCGYSWSPAPSAGNPSVLNIGTLATGGGSRRQ